jgi:hypothetical protein
MAALVLMVALCACSTEHLAPAPTDIGCINYDNPKLFADAATMTDDVVPIFQAACNYNGCHNSRDVAQQLDLPLGPYLGNTATKAELDEVHEALVSVDAQLSAMKLVVPGDAAASFLLVKLEYADILGCETVTCTKLSCGRRMPFDDPPLLDGQLALIRAWIRDGAVR